MISLSFFVFSMSRIGDDLKHSQSKTCKCFYLPTHDAM